MNHWRVTKYNPQYRNRKGVYTKEEWTEVADIGNSNKSILPSAFYETEQNVLFGGK